MGSAESQRRRVPKLNHLAAARESPNLHPGVPQSRQPMEHPPKYPDLPEHPKSVPERSQNMKLEKPEFVLPVTTRTNKQRQGLNKVPRIGTLFKWLAI